MSQFQTTMSLLDGKGRRKYLNSVERKLFFRNANNLDKEKKLFCLFLYWTGVRISEAINIDVCQIDFDEHKVVIKSLKKRGKTVFRQIPIPEHFSSELMKYISGNRLEEKPFLKDRRTYSRYVKSLMKQSGIDGPQASPKGLRHSFAVHCLMKSIPLTLIQKWMGHSSITTTAIYLNVVGEEERKFAERIWKLKKD